MKPHETSRAAELCGILSGTEDGVAAIGPDHKVTGISGGATRILGYSGEQAIGRPCYEVFGGHDRCGNPVCGPDCTSLANVRRGELVPTRDILARDRSGRKVWLSLTTLVPPRRYADECLLVHIFRETALPPELERLISERLRGAGRPSALDVLSLREREVLHLLAEGLGTQEIAQRLCISPATVRNHVQHILGRLKVGSRLEAVALALREPLRAAS
jgi:DNA-binding CsgD family transcriptional regulator